MFEAKGPGEYITRATITTTGKDRHFDPASGNVYFYDRSGNVAFGVYVPELPVVAQAHRGTVNMFIQRTNDIALMHRSSNRRQLLVEQVKRFELDNRYVQLGLDEIVKAEHAKMTQLHLTPEMTVRFVTLTRRGKYSSAVMEFGEFPHRISLNELFVLQGLHHGYSPYDLGKLYGHQNSHVVQQCLQSMAERNGFPFGDEKGRAVDQIISDLAPHAVFTLENVAAIEQRVFDLHRETQVLPAHIDNTHSV